MKLLISIIIGLAVMIGIYCLDGYFINYIILQLPKAWADGAGLIRIILWILAIFWTTGLAIIAGFLGGIITAAITGLLKD